MLSGKSFMITGATGRLGCETAARLEQLGANVIPVALKGYPPKPKRVRWTARSKPVNIMDGKGLKDIKPPDYVINLHWLVDRELSFTDQLQYELDSGVSRISYFWDWLKELSCHRFVNISSTKVFSHLNLNPISAETDPRPISPYGLAKLTAERFFDAYFYRSNFPVIQLRLCSVASYGEHPTHIMSQLFYSAFKKKAIKVNSSHTMNILYIDDAVDLIINAVLHADKSIYILATPPIAVYEIARRFEEISGKKINAELVDSDPKLTNPVFQSDIELLSASWIRKTDLDSMIDKIIDLNLFHSKVSGDLEAKFHFKQNDQLPYH
jgi:nucleoside-diphosphate-sugar epimerase